MAGALYAYLYYPVASMILIALNGVILIFAIISRFER